MLYSKVEAEGIDLKSVFEIFNIQIDTNIHKQYINTATNSNTDFPQLAWSINNCQGTFVSKISTLLGVKYFRMALLKAVCGLLQGLIALTLN